MLNLLKALRYLVFLLFVICNAIITSVAVWNLSVVSASPFLATARQLDAYLVFVGASGLVLIFPIIFFELYGKNVFVGRVWFELLWVGAFWVMELVGAAAITSQSDTQLCQPQGLTFSVNQESPCVSSQVLQAFTWICAILLLGYLALLAISAIVKHNDDPTIWHCSVRRFPWLSGGRVLKSIPTSPLAPKFRTQAPVIAAPRPTRIAALRDTFLSYRSGLSLDYDIEHFHPPQQGPVVSAERPVPPVPAALSPQTRQRSQQPAISTPFYASYVQHAINPNALPPVPAQLTQIRPLPRSPPPLGDWPRLDATSRPPRTKPKPLRQAMPSHASHAFDPAALAAALQPLASSSHRSRPSGPRRRSMSGEDHRPPRLDLSNISTHRTRGHS